jgi:hypothetical protein
VVRTNVVVVNWAAVDEFRMDHSSSLSAGSYPSGGRGDNDDDSESSDSPSDAIRPRDDYPPRNRAQV